MEFNEQPYLHPHREPLTQSTRFVHYEIVYREVNFFPTRGNATTLYEPHFSHLLGEDKSSVGFLSFGTIDMLDWIILCCHVH